MTLKPGSILRRGADKLTAVELKTLMDNPVEVERIIKDINTRRAVYLKTEGDVKAALKKLEGVQKVLAKREAVLAEGQTALEAGCAEAAAVHAADMGALGRRTKEVLEKEAKADERDAALGQRENAIERSGRTRETEFAAREGTLDARGKACDDRERSGHEREAGVTTREKRNEDKAKQTLEIWR